MKQLDPKSVWLFFLGSTFSLIFTIFIFLFIFANFIFLLNPDFKMNFVIFLSIILLLVAFQYLIAWLSYKNYKYEMRADGFRKEHGVIWKKYVTIPYERIQNVDILRGPFARLLGLSDLQIQTAGMSGTVGSYGGGSEGRLPGLNLQVAEQLRDQLITHARGKNQGL